jgi:hypothetical protein
MYLGGECLEDVILLAWLFLKQEQGIEFGFPKRRPLRLRNQLNRIKIQNTAKGFQKNKSAYLKPKWLPRSPVDGGFNLFVIFTVYI